MVKKRFMVNVNRFHNSIEISLIFFICILIITQIFRNQYLETKEMKQKYEATVSKHKRQIYLER